MRKVPLLLIALVLVIAALGFRFFQATTLPPWLWFDEAGNGLDARALLAGDVRAFYPRSLGKEALYIYLITPFVAAWDGQALAIRGPAMLLGVLMVPALIVCGRALLPERPHLGWQIGLLAAAFWAVNFWPQSINRIGFRVNTLPVILTLAVTFWLLFTQRPTRARALTFGAAAAAVLYTYLAARATLLLWPGLWLFLPPPRRRAVLRMLPWALLAFSLVVAPLALHFALNPHDLVERVETIVDVEDGGSLWGWTKVFARETVRVAGVFMGFTGDPWLRHNIPDRPPFSPLLGIAFVAGALWVAKGIVQRTRIGPTLAGWLGIMALPAILAAEHNPHSLRLFGALPAAFLIAALGVLASVHALLATRWFRAQPQRSAIVRGALPWLLCAWLIVEGSLTARAYFHDWAALDHYEEYQGDVAHLVELTEAEPDVLWVAPTVVGHYALEYQLPRGHLLELLSHDVLAWEEMLQSWLGARGGATVATPVWWYRHEIHADPKRRALFYLEREGTPVDHQSFRGVSVHLYRLTEQPDFTAPGQTVTLDHAYDEGITLSSIRLGAAAPNPDRSATSIAAGTNVWAILTWHMAEVAATPRATLELRDSGGNLLARADQNLWIETPYLDPADWRDTTVTTVHLLTIPPTQSPETLTLWAQLYHDDSLLPILPLEAPAPLTSITSLPPTGPIDVTPDLGAPDGIDLGGIRLLGMDAWPASIRAGIPLTLKLYAARENPDAAATLRVALMGTDAQAEVNLPTDVALGTPFHRYVSLEIPPDTPTGSYRLAVGATTGDAAVTLPWGEVRVENRPHRTELPSLSYTTTARFGMAVALEGVVLPDGQPALPALNPGDALSFDLVWRVNTPPDQDVVRFVHWVDAAGELIGQEDTTPCQATCPSATWTAQEVLVDRVTLTVPETATLGEVRLLVGWYDSATQTRLRAWQDSQRLVDDALPLSLPVTVR